MSKTSAMHTLCLYDITYNSLSWNHFEEARAPAFAGSFDALLAGMCICIDVNVCFTDRQRGSTRELEKTNL
jgi:hypothetical protein